ncbi:MAG: hypothetical protein WB526_04515 [Candidatus Cybelea sp.]
MPTVYQDSNMDYFGYCGYDDAGNLFADGSGKYQLALAELPAGGTSLIDISVSQSIGNPGQVQWDGSYITVQDEAAPGSIYQLEVSGSTATIAGVTKLDGITHFADASWIQGHTVLVGSKPGRKPMNIRFWRYPQGGKAYQRIDGFKRGATVLGLTVSLAKH